ncbi:MAG: hypothetical protein HYV27_01955 [Candidatus Hydrogenedentes bacterium]|nr:hypothetical protein [Candidatus Hydrogenedentota bacterium]
MYWSRILPILCVLMGLAMTATAVEPAYYGEEFGNAEEPALRPYKWIFNGVKSLVWHTQDQFVRGNMMAPVVGSTLALRGARRGTVELLESTFHGAVFAPPPPKGYHKEKHRANDIIEEDLFLRNSSDFLFSWYFFPVQKAVDHRPRVSAARVDEQLQQAKIIRDERKEAQKKREGEIVESRVKRAQRYYVGERAEYGSAREREGRGDLTRLGQ